MSTKLNTNGQAARKSLAEQIDRLDGMLDGLSDGLSEAVAAAVKDAVGAAVQQAVQAVLREMLTSPELLARLHAAAPTTPAPTAATPIPAAAPKTPKVSWKQRWASVRQALAACVAMARLECGRRLEQARRWAAGALDRVRILGRFSYPLVAAVVVGVTAGVAACYARPWLAAAVSGAGGLAATAAAQARTAWSWLTTPAVAWIG